ncbi:hypothetical protein C900_05639 [Fulvivirga imtechensis AK7]|uniref:Uncharacterized protein n=1 Tax=Fulvivirga imtechensis AK7 TaxID=1237149 RepID=L8JJ66_9BACT|nr:hypothetical protein [Fulvivirga imtechensis]ELR68946.1 hypothetical protein C900_05639 [Fulvivirga imtechensis AK7]
MKKILIPVMLSAIATLSLGQHIDSHAGKVTIIDGSVNPGGVVDEIKLPPPEVVGTYYINDDWQMGEVTMVSKLIFKNYPLKYNIEGNYLEILVQGQPKVCDEKLFKSFKWFNAMGDSSRFVHCRYYKSEVPCIHGVYEIIYERGKIQLLSKTEVYERDPTYVAALNAGDRNIKLIKRESFYLANENSVKEIHSSKKQNEAVFGDKFDEVLRYAKKEKLKFNNRKDLVEIIDFYVK